MAIVGSLRWLFAANGHFENFEVVSTASDEVAPKAAERLSGVTTSNSDTSQGRSAQAKN